MVLSKLLFVAYNYLELLDFLNLLAQDRNEEIRKVL